MDAVLQSFLRCLFFDCLFKKTFIYCSENIEGLLLVKPIVFYSLRLLMNFASLVFKEMLLPFVFKLIVPKSTNIFVNHF